jgi:hypothetical protein
MLPFGSTALTMPTCSLPNARLARAQLLHVDGGRGSRRDALLVANALQPCLQGLQLVTATREAGDCLGELLASEILATLAQCTDALEAKSERGSGAHRRVIGRCARFLSAPTHPGALTAG